MNLLIIGGTQFVGRHIAYAALERGDRVTLFNRGRTQGDAIAGVEQVHGDRNGDLHRLDGRTWDAVIDACGYTPVEVEISARYFSERTGAYVFISTISVYDQEGVSSIDEDSPLCAWPREADRTRMTPETYGPLKVSCEDVVSGAFGERSLIVRPGLVAGAYDPTDRFTYWPVRCAAGGEILAPGAADHPIQYIDARDLGAFTISLAHQRATGIYNAVTTPDSVTFGDLFSGCFAANGAAAPVRYASETFLEKHSVAPWSDLPLWIPRSGPGLAMVRISNARSRARGLHVRPVAESARGVLEWAVRTGKRVGALQAGLTLERETELLRSL